MKSLPPGATGQRSSTTGCGIVSQRSPQVGTPQPSLADVPPDRDEVVVTREHVREAELPPHLAEPRVDVEEDAPPGGGEQLGVAHEAHHVEQEARARGAFERLLPREPAERLPSVAEDAVGDARPPRAARAGSGARPPRCATGMPRLEPVDDGHVEAELAEAEHVLEQRPGVSAVPGALRERRADDDRVGHCRAAYGTGCAARSVRAARGSPIDYPLRFTRTDTSRRVEMPASGFSPPLRPGRTSRSTAASCSPGSRTSRCKRQRRPAVRAGPAHDSLGPITNNPCTAGKAEHRHGMVTYTPTGGHSGSDSFTYKVNDGTNDSAAATVLVTVNGPPSYNEAVLKDCRRGSSGSMSRRGRWRVIRAVGERRRLPERGNTRRRWADRRRKRGGVLRRSRRSGVRAQFDELVSDVGGECGSV